ncbi:MAG: hypothetical protein QM479_05340 [Pseudomonadota bacterium]
MSMHLLKMDQLNISKEQSVLLERQISEHPKFFVKIAQYFTLLDSEIEEKGFPPNYYDELFKDNPTELLKMLIEWQMKKKTQGDLLCPEFWDKSPLTREEFNLLEENHKAFDVNSVKVWQAEEGCVGVNAFVAKMKSLGNNSTKNSLANMVRDNLTSQKLIGYKQGSGKKSPWSLPIWQIDRHTGGILNGIADVCHIFNSNGYAVQEFMVSNHLGEKNKPPLQLIREGRIRSLISIATEYENL